MSAAPQSRVVSIQKTAVKPDHHLFWYAALVIFAAICVGAWALSMRMQKLEVQVASPVRKDIETTISSSGFVAPENDYPIRANFSGIVEKVFVHVGQQVHAGQMLIRMKDQYAALRVATASAALKESELNLQNALQNGTQDEHITYDADLARAKVERDDAAAAVSTLQKLEQRGSVSDSEVQNGMRRLQLADNALQSLRTRMTHRYGPADIASLKAKVHADQDSLVAERVSWANANISAPIDGTVYAIPVLPYDFVQGGGELLRMADLTRFVVRSNFFEPDIGRLQIGQPATIQWDGAPGKLWSGQVLTRPLSVDRSGPVGIGHCTIALTSPLGNLPLNSSVTVMVQTQKDAHVLALPREAVYGSGSNHFVYRVLKGRLQKTPVRTGIFNPMEIEIVSGLTERDPIALHSVDGSPLHNNAPVAIAENQDH